MSSKTMKAIQPSIAVSPRFCCGVDELITPPVGPEYALQSVRNLSVPARHVVAGAWAGLAAPSHPESRSSLHGMDTPAGFPSPSSKPRKTGEYISGYTPRRSLRPSAPAGIDPARLDTRTAS